MCIADLVVLWVRFERLCKRMPAEQAWMLVYGVRDV